MADIPGPNGHTPTTTVTKARPRNDFYELGSTGLNQWNGYVQDEFLLELSGDRARRVFREMSDNDPVVGSVLFALDMLMRQVEWEVQPANPADPSEAQRDLADFVLSCLHDMSATWADTLSAVFSMAVYGWAYCELVYKRRQGRSDNPTLNSAHDDGRIGWRKIPLRLQRTLYKWEFDAQGGVQGMWQAAPPTFSPVLIPISKGLLFRTSTATGNPEGRSILRNAYRPWFFKNRIEEIEGIGIERDLAGLPIAWVPPSMMSADATPAERQAFEQIRQIVANVRTDENQGIIFPLAYDDGGHKLYDFGLLSTGGTRNFDTDKVIGRYDQRIAMTALADFILLGHEKVGSFALGSTKVGLFTTAMWAWLSMIAEVFNAHAIPKLLQLNGDDPADSPRLVPGEVRQVEMAEVGDYLTKLSGAGMTLFPDSELEEHLRRIGSMPPKSAEAEAAQEAAAALAAAAPPPGGAPGRPARPDGNPSQTKTPAPATGASQV